jgi:peptidoglycan/xylan/chitin deacetylase (PgdA/CDA1 family)
MSETRLNPKHLIIIVTIVVWSLFIIFSISLNASTSHLPRENSQEMINFINSRMEDEGYGLRWSDRRDDWILDNDVQEHFQYDYSSQYIDEILSDDEITVLTYHHLLHEEDMVGQYQDNKYVLSVESFYKEMEYLRLNDYYVLTTDEFEQCVEGAMPIPEKSVYITFDDGYLSNFEYAYPILKEFNFTATIFLISDYIAKDSEVFDASQLQIASVEDLERCKDVFDYGNHTANLHQKKDGKPLIYTSTAEEIKEDVTKYDWLTELFPDDTVKHLAYPYGAFNHISTKVLRELEYQFVFLTEHGQVNSYSASLFIPRYSICSDADFDCLFK